MKIKIIDNFLDQRQLHILQSEIVWNTRFPFYLQENVALHKEAEDQYNTNNWNWYAVHHIFGDGQVQSEIFNLLDHFILSNLRVKELLRIKVNFFGHTNKVEEHLKHIDYAQPHIGAIFCLNTCDGFTRFEDGTKVDSIENRFYMFEGHKKHNSSTTSNVKGRFNINFNFTSNDKNLLDE